MPAPEPVPASWVQVGPGKYVRGEVPNPAPDLSVEDATEATSSDVEMTRSVVPEEDYGDPGAGDSPDDPGEPSGDSPVHRGEDDLGSTTEGQ